MTKGKTFLIVAVALAAIYPIATGDYRFIGLTSRVQAFGEIAAERSASVGKELFEFFDESQTQLTKAAEANEGNDLQIPQDNQIRAESGLSHSTPLLPSPIPDIKGTAVIRNAPDLHASPGAPGRFQVISRSEKIPPLMIDTRTGASWFLNGELDQRNWFWSPIQHGDDASILMPVKP